MKNGYVFSFKIDLIVWKWYSSQKDTIIKAQFKIDLIVWKQDSSFCKSLQRHKFKIDLIVWKFIQNCGKL